MINRENIQTPQISLTKAAIEQLRLIKEHDYTLKDKVLRLQIDGKGCDGFKYTMGFTDVDAQDFIIKGACSFDIAIDPFCAFYLQNGEIQYKPPGDFDDDEGFHIVNHDQENFQGKFWKNKDHLVPPTI